VSTVLFKDWLPDQPDFNNPGLIEALNAVPVGDGNSGFEPYDPLSTANNTFNSSFPLNHVALLASSPGGSTPDVYVATFDGHVYQSAASAGIWTDLSGGGFSQPAVSLVQYNDLIFVAAGSAGIYSQTSGSSSTFNAVLGAPNASVLGIIGQFLVAGNISALPTVFPHLVGWSSIANPTDWPTPGSDSALASQAGEQFLHMELGGVTGIFGGDQWGVILQQNGITRVTYIGGVDVFQFDTLSGGIGMDSQGCGVKVGNQIYFCSSRGFYSTDGVSVAPIGEGKVNLWFIQNVVTPGYLSKGRCAVDWTNKIIYWSFPVGNPSPVVMYNYETQRFTHASDTNIGAMVAGNVASFTSVGLLAIGQDNRLGTFTGTPGTATFISGEAELTPGSYTRISGIKPLVGATANAMVSSVGYRNDLQSAVTFDTDTTQNSRSGFADFRREARYHRARVKVTGTFKSAQGLEFNAVPGGAV
jgi:hypothetical protein